MKTASRGRIVLASAFLVYAVALVVGTHWPSLDLGESPAGSDKWLHLAAYAGWAMLGIASGLFGPWWATRTFARVVVIGAAVAALDEATQGLPGINRHPSLGDWAADLLGLLSGGAVAWWFGRARRGARRGGGGGDTPDSGRFA